mmetsp:Transcript_22530/g.37789  ORF Transcript_22530/g.37789 Transcript_22530/m.37789 type:complete len:885 (+) Transcript_22530:162-2816(+)|eukprot:CAMPEP_0184338022 /NCGR_PEP_ID=MMETSP1089-20130417/6539_1 /TAXON_ID=38269 ORGANISM="Gloeochaete wittrockiana, Strain SAG46.84" /NCGR_SAMPLE_ID=MMETSP1089 /ASSEMBLY_ACC=CAM_ASM_000445 /LENGTH=884 /DNA_ID=CAMNT_0026664249 /DNA_START=161 /DNA_END=2815 /DNA_ORIENTATION=-
MSRSIDIDLSAVHYEPIHLIEKVQPHGIFFVLLDTSRHTDNASGSATNASSADHDLVVIQSANAKLLGYGSDNEVLNKSLKWVLGAAAFKTLSDALGEGRWPSADGNDLSGINPIQFFAIEKDFVDSTRQWNGLATSLSNSLIMLEVEPMFIGRNIYEPLLPSDSRSHVGSDHPLLKNAIDSLQGAETVDQLCQSLAQEVSNLFGYDRTMVYAFGPEGHGKVLAEVLLDKSLEPYIGLQYPATDIPKVARNLFLTNRVRVIADAKNENTPIVPTVNPITKQATDMTNSVLRAVSNCHLQYMANMGVRASVSNAIVKDKKLWGLFICYHHSGPRYMGYTERQACIVLGQVLSVLLADKASRVHREYCERAKNVQLQMYHNIAEYGLIESLLRREPNMMALFVCDGAAIVTGSKVETVGNVPPFSMILDLVMWLDQSMDEEIWWTDCLSGAWENGYLIKDVASGVLAVSVCSGRSEYLLWFRSEVSKMIAWAGASANAVVRSESGNLCPRSSFAKLLELVSGTSDPFNSVDLVGAKVLRSMVIESVLNNEGEMRKAGDFLSFLNQRFHDTMPGRSLALEISSFIESLPLPVFGLDSEGRVNEWNPAIARATGYSKDEVMGRKFVESVVSFEAQAVMAEDLDRALKGDASASQLQIPIYAKQNTSTSSNEERLKIGNALFARDTNSSNGVLGMLLLELNNDYPLEHRVSTETSSLIEAINTVLNLSAGASDTKIVEILLIEDHPFYKSTTFQLLQKTGFKVDQQLNSEDGVCRFAERALAVKSGQARMYDAIVMDCYSANMRQMEAAAKIREIEREGSMTRTPMITYAAFAILGDEIKCQEVGMDYYTTKPVIKNALVDTVKRWLPHVSAIYISPERGTSRMQTEFA